MERIAVKLARGLVAFELNEPQLEEPDAVSMAPLMLMSDRQRRDFEGVPGRLAAWPEVGGRAFNRLALASDDTFREGWIVVEEDRFRYRVTQEQGTNIRMVVREYLAMEVVWA